jgi:hypothetical protein
MFIVLEYMHLGSLKDYLKSNVIFGGISGVIIIGGRVSPVFETCTGSCQGNGLFTTVTSIA